MPPATPLNYIPWVFVCFIFNYIIRRQSQVLYFTTRPRNLYTGEPENTQMRLAYKHFST
jgi:hypothetical protein